MLRKTHNTEKFGVSNWPKAYPLLQHSHHLELIKKVYPGFRDEISEAQKGEKYFAKEHRTCQLSQDILHTFRLAMNSPAIASDQERQKCALRSTSDLNSPGPELFFFFFKQDHLAILKYKV